jgi:hypothetical protein
MRFPKSIARRAAVGVLALAAAGGGTVVLAGGASAATTAQTTAAVRHQPNRCAATLTYEKLGFFGGQFVLVRNVCDVEVFHNGFGRHSTENLFYEQQRHGFRTDHFVRNVRDVRVFGGFGDV